jgi:hypothetical protein
VHKQGQRGSEWCHSVGTVHGVQGPAHIVIGQLFPRPAESGPVAADSDVSASLPQQLQRRSSARALSLTPPQAPFSPEGVVTGKLRRQTLSHNLVSFSGSHRANLG